MYYLFWNVQETDSCLVGHIKRVLIITVKFICQQKVISLSGTLRPGSDAVLHMSRIEFEFRSTQINLDRLN